MIITSSTNRPWRTHYEVLGVDPSAGADAIRAAYRRRARAVHPDAGDRSVDDPAGEMSALNEAYRVLRDPARRVVYDRSLVGEGAPGAAPSGSDAPTTSTPRSSGPYPAGPTSPARVPWRAMLAVAAIGSAVVVVGAAFVEPGTSPAPDGILRPGSCVAIEANGDAVEIDCAGEGDRVVVELVAFDQRCPAATLAHRDRQGLGIACIATEGR